MSTARSRGGRLCAVVLAGNYHQYDDWRRSNGLELYEGLWIDSLCSLYRLQGLMDVDFVRAGTWYHLSSELIAEFSLRERITRGRDEQRVQDPKAV